MRTARTVVARRRAGRSWLRWAAASAAFVLASGAAAAVAGAAAAVAGAAAVTGAPAITAAAASGQERSSVPQRDVVFERDVAVERSVVPVNAAVAGASADLVDAGAAHTCMISSGAAYCWGSNSHGQLGDGTTTDRARPVAVEGGDVLAGVTLTQISAGTRHTCALSSTGLAYCWGDNGAGQLGDGTRVGRTRPVAVDIGGGSELGDVTFTQLSAGGGHTCAVSAGAPYCWGDNGDGQLGDGTTTDRAYPVAVERDGVLAGVTLTRVGAGDRHSCALSSTGAAYCWGADGSGQLGDGGDGDDGDGGNGGDGAAGHPGPAAVAGNLAFAQLSVGGVHTCGVSTGGAGYCWGSGDSGRLGTGGSIDVAWSPVPVDTGGALAGLTLTRVGAGDRHGCALSSTGAAYCWGANASGQLGDATTTTSPGPVAVDASGVLAGVALAGLGAGGAHGCALSSAGLAYCWGANGSGQVGDGSDADRLRPVAVRGVAPDPPTAVEASAGERRVAVAWTGPGRSGTGTLTGYTATASPGGASCTAGATGTGCEIAGLDGGVEYTVVVVAHGTAGNSAASRASAPVTPFVLPGVPTGVTARAGDAAVEVRWVPPADFGTGRLTGYEATASPGGASCSSATAAECVITGLANGTAYTVTVVTRTSVGESATSVASAPVTPGALPDPPGLADEVPAGAGPLHSSTTEFSSTSRTATLTGGGFAPGSRVTVGIYSEPVTLTTVTADSVGAFQVEVVVPEGYSGAHTLVAVGLAPDGGVRTLAVDIRVAAARAGVDGGAGAGYWPTVAIVLGFGLLVAGAVGVLAYRGRSARFAAE